MLERSSTFVDLSATKAMVPRTQRVGGVVEVDLGACFALIIGPCGRLLLGCILGRVKAVHLSRAPRRQPFTAATLGAAGAAPPVRAARAPGG